MLLLLVLLLEVTAAILFFAYTEQVRVTVLPGTLGPSPGLPTWTGQAVCSAGLWVPQCHSGHITPELVSSQPKEQRWLPESGRTPQCPGAGRGSGSRGKGRRC